MVLFTKGLEEGVEYKEATDLLFARITATDVAEELGISHNAVVRARLNSSTRDYRPPPKGWQRVVAKLANQRAEELLELSRNLVNSG